MATDKMPTTEEIKWAKDWARGGGYHEGHAVRILLDALEAIDSAGICGEVLAERARQDKKWGQQNHHPMEWLAILGEEVGEVNKAALETYWNYRGRIGDYSEYRRELIQTAAACFAMIECLDRNEVKR